MKIHISYTADVDITTKLPKKFEKDLEEFEKLDDNLDYLTEEERTKWEDIRRVLCDWAVNHVYKIEKTDDCVVNWVESDGAIIYDRDLDGDI